jgi:threonine 3-dehydrogenase
METMQALTVTPATEWEGTGFVKREVPKPLLNEVANPDDALWVIIKPTFTGVCGSDRGIWYRTSFGDVIKQSLKNEGNETRTIGHELYGDIVEIGSKVDSRYKVGDMVAAESHVTCGVCYQCERGERHVCTEEQIMGIGINGCFAEYVKLPAAVLWPTNTDLIRPEVACMQEPFGNGVHACSQVDLKGKTVAILGCGPIGLFSVLIAKAQGARQIIAIDPSEKSRALAKDFGADHVLSTAPSEDAYDKTLVEAIMKLTDNVGVDVAMEMAGFPISVVNATKSVRRGGDIILFGIKSGSVTIPDFDRLIVRGITLHSVIGREVFKTWDTTKALLEDKSNGVHDQLWEKLLQKGEGTIVDFATYDPAEFEKAMNTHPKIIMRF